MVIYLTVLKEHSETGHFFQPFFINPLSGPHKKNGFTKFILFGFREDTCEKCVFAESLTIPI